MLSVTDVITATLIAAVVTFSTRVFPFLFFAKKQPPDIVLFIQKYIPPMTMVILVVYCVKDIDWVAYPHGFPALAGILTAFVLHIWRNNVLLSIFGATALYMLLIRVM